MTPDEINAVEYQKESAKLRFHREAKFVALDNAQKNISQRGNGDLLDVAAKIYEWLIKDL